MLYESKSRPWNSLELLLPVRMEDVVLSPEELREAEPQLWKDICAEYDAEHLCIMLEESNLSFSDEFVSFEKVWRRDEYNHYLGFRRIYSLFYGVDELAIVRRLEQRKADFSTIRDYFTDEFKLCLLLAYDELVTVRAFNEDIPFYRALGPAVFNEWIRLVKADEALHYMNALRVAQVRHPHRLAEAEAVLREILYIDLNEEYHATFVLDHKGPPFTPEMLHEACNTLLETISRPADPMRFY